MTEQLITRYRPARLLDVFGHVNVVKILQAKVDNPHETHCFLFSGDPGLGKTTLAMVMANELKCGEIDEFDAGTQSGVDAMRDKVAAIQYPPLSGKSRAIVVNECHALSTQAWNSLLINLENPPAFNYWFFTTTNPSKVPVAVKRRCVDFNLTGISAVELTEFLWSICDAETLEPAKGVVELCVTVAQGSPGKALAALTKVIDLKTLKEVEEALEWYGDGPAEAVDLARAFAQNKSWMQIVPILRRIEVSKIESVRYVVVNYVAKMALDTDYERAHSALQVLRAFSQPFATGEGLAPLLIAVDKALALNDPDVPF